MDRLCDILTNQRRRSVLTYLSGTEGAATLNDLTEQTAAWECGTEIARIASQERKRVYVSLSRSHLPKMADASAITSDKSREEIGIGDTSTRSATLSVGLSERRGIRSTGSNDPGNRPPLTS